MFLWMVGLVLWPSAALVTVMMGRSAVSARTRRALPIANSARYEQILLVYSHILLANRTFCLLIANSEPVFRYLFVNRTFCLLIANSVC